MGVWGGSVLPAFRPQPALRVGSGQSGCDKGVLLDMCRHSGHSRHFASVLDRAVAPRTGRVAGWVHPGPCRSAAVLVQVGMLASE